MKMFNWLNRKLHLKAEELAQDDDQKDCLISDESRDDIRNLLGSDSFSSVFDGWKGGILAIGTFGYDHEYYRIQQESPVEKNNTDPDDDEEKEEGEEEEDDDDDEDEGVNLLVNAASLSHDYKGFSGPDQNGVSPRTTLAELFSADAEEKQKRANSGEREIMGENLHSHSHSHSDSHSAYYNPHLSSTKKLRKEDATRPVRKLHCLLRRMLKKRVHPDINRNTKVAVRKSPSLVGI